MFLFKNSLRNSFAIDLGTNNTLVYQPRKGIILEEATSLSFDKQRKEFFNFGNSSKKMLGKSPQNIEVVRPLSKGAISNLISAKEYIKNLIRQIPRNPLVKPNIFVSVPSDLNYMERNAVIEAGKSGGAKNVFLIKDPFSAAIGYLKDISRPNGILVLDIGAGVSEISLLSCNGIVKSKSLRIAGNDIDEAIIEYFKNVKRVLLSSNNAELLKKELADMTSQEEKTLCISAKNLITHMPENFTVSSRDVQKAIKPIVDKIVVLSRSMIENLPSAFLSDAYDQGILLTGGSSMLKNLDAYLEQELHVKIKVVDTPLQNIILGAGAISESFAYHSLVSA
jgi:rod shape-determining protein MreB